MSTGKTTMGAGHRKVPTFSFPGSGENRRIQSCSWRGNGRNPLAHYDKAMKTTKRFDSDLATEGERRRVRPGS
jgi:hypothetical protein